MKHKSTTIILSLLFSISCFVSASDYKTKWSANPYEHKAFIENKGQFSSVIDGGKKIFFSAQLGKINAYFTSKGIVYRYDEYSKNEKEEKREVEIEKAETKTYFLSATWENSNPDLIITAEEKQSDYYSYSEGKTNITANLFKKLIYKNIYPNIDIEYIFPEGKEGIKYSIILHPGADVSQVKLKYSGSKGISIDNYGNLIVKSEMGIFTDHAPQSFYESNHQAIVSSFSLKNNTVSFSLNSKIISSTIIIDPWTSNPLFASVNRALDIDFDDAGNVYAYGGLNPFQLVKFNSAGVKLWTYNVPQTTGSNYGCFAVDKTTGTSYVFHGSSPNPNSDKVFKVNTNGVLLKSLFSVISLEFWRAKYDRCTHQLIVGSG